MKTILLLFSISIILAACSESKPESQPIPATTIDSCSIQPYTKTSELDFYIQKHLPFKIAAKDTVFFVPLGSCSSCVAMTLDALFLNKYSGKIILGGKLSDHEQFADRIDLLTKNEHFWDSTYFMYQYDLEIVSPTMIILDDDKKYRFAQLSFDNWECIAQKLKWTLPEITEAEH